jgi:hypothetical protein
LSAQENLRTFLEPVNVPHTPRLVLGRLRAESAAACRELRFNTSFQDCLIDVGVLSAGDGATTCSLERSGDSVARLHLRSLSLANWPEVAPVVPGDLLPDFPLINKSFELCSTNLTVRRRAQSGSHRAARGRR